MENKKEIDGVSVKEIRKQINGDGFTFGELYVDLADDYYKNWLVIQDQTVTYDRGRIILEDFCKNFPMHKPKDYDELIEVASRSEKLSRWLADANIRYADFATMPTYLEKLVEPKEFKELTKKISKVNDVVAGFQEQRDVLSREYKLKVRELDKRQREEIDKIKGTDNILKILTIKTTNLPMTLQFVINRYKPSDTENKQETRETFAREMLIQYKTALIKYTLKNPSIDISKIIDENELK